MLLIQFANRMYHRCKFVRKYIHMYYDCEVWSLVRVLSATHAQHFLKRKHTHLCVCNTKSYSSSQNVKSIIEHIVGCVMMPLNKQVSCVFVCCMNMLLGVGDSGEAPVYQSEKGSADPVTIGGSSAESGICSKLPTSFSSFMAGRKGALICKFLRASTEIVLNHLWPTISAAPAFKLP